VNALLVWVAVSLPAAILVARFVARRRHAEPSGASNDPRLLEAIAENVGGFIRARMVANLEGLSTLRDGDGARIRFENFSVHLDAERVRALAKRVRVKLPNPPEGA
jgi:hypothetical protein